MAEAYKSELSRSDAYRLRLSIEEAETLFVVLGGVGGDQEVSPRKHAQSVMDALKGIGITREGTNSIRDLRDGAIYFQRYPAPKPAFEPGHFVDTGDFEIRWFTSDPSDFGADGEWLRVTVPPAGE